MHDANAKYKIAEALENRGPVFQRELQEKADGAAVLSNEMTKNDRKIRELEDNAQNATAFLNRTQNNTVSTRFSARILSFENEISTLKKKNRELANYYNQHLDEIRELMENY